MKKIFGILAVCVAAGVVSMASCLAAASETETNNVLSELKKEQERLSLENTITDAQLKKELAAQSAEKQRLELKNSLAQQKLQAEIAALQAEIDKLAKQADLLNRRTALKEAEQRAKLNEELLADRERLERMRLTNDLAAAELAAKSRELTQREQELRVKSAELQAQRGEFDFQLAKLNTELDLRTKKDFWKSRVNRDLQYTTEPFKDGVLTISDRRVPLNGVITPDVADHIAARIDYFNNQNPQYPIFLVIDRSPGGSVMGGYKILKAMEGSAAPVYVVVKSYAASMAANIATQAKKSFAYPNAIILHHQILSGGYGNLTEQKERIKELEEWWRRLAAPVATKMGVPLDEFIKQMYANRSSGDWLEFGDRARQLKWVDEIALTVREESFDRSFDEPSGPGSPPPSIDIDTKALEERVDAQGRRHVVLPRLDPVDCYYLYNPDNYYRFMP